MIEYILHDSMLYGDSVIGDHYEQTPTFSLVLQYNKKELTTITMNMYSVSVHGMCFPNFHPLSLRVHVKCL